MYRVIQFFKKIGKIIRYIPILWKDEDWSWEHIVNLLIFKLGRVRDLMYHSIGVEGPEQARIIDEIIYFLRKATNEDNYCRDELDEHRKKWGCQVYNILGRGSKDVWREDVEEKVWEKLCNKGKPDKEHENTRVKAYFSKCKTAEEQSRADKEYYEICDKKRKLQQEDLERCFAEIGKYIQRWWD